MVLYTNRLYPHKAEEICWNEQPGDFTKMGHQDGKFNMFQRPGETIKLKDEIDQQVQDSFCKLKIRRGRAHQLLANSESLHNKDSRSSLWNQTAVILKKVL